MTHPNNNILAKTAGIFESFFCCAAASTRGVNDDATVYTFPELPAPATSKQRRKDKNDVYEHYNVKSSYSSASTSDRAIVSADSFVSSKQRTSTTTAGSIVFLDAFEPQIRPVLHFPASASIKTATTASMSSTHSLYSVPTIKGSQTFDNDSDDDDCGCSLNSDATTQITRPQQPRSISSATTAKIKTPTPYHHHHHHHYREIDNDHSIHRRHVQTTTTVTPPVLTATDGYRCEVLL